IAPATKRQRINWAFTRDAYISTLSRSSEFAHVKLVCDLICLSLANGQGRRGLAVFTQIELKNPQLNRLPFAGGKAERSHPLLSLNLERCSLSVFHASARQALHTRSC